MKSSPVFSTILNNLRGNKFNKLIGLSLRKRCKEFKTLEKEFKSKEDKFLLGKYN